MYLLCNKSKQKKTRTDKNNQMKSDQMYLEFYENFDIRNISSQWFKMNNKETIGNKNYLMCSIQWHISEEYFGLEFWVCSRVTDFQRGQKRINCKSIIAIFME